MSGTWVSDLILVIQKKIRSGSRGSDLMKIRSWTRVSDLIPLSTPPLTKTMGTCASPPTLSLTSKENNVADSGLRPRFSISEEIKVGDSGLGDWVRDEKLRSF